VRAYRISQLAERTGVPATTLRFYEKEGLLAAARTAAGYRTYTDDDAERVRFIGTAKGLGLSLSRIRALLDVRDGGLCREVRDELRDLVADRIAETHRRIADLHSFRRHLDVAAGHLRDLPTRAVPCGPDCAELHDEPAVACSLDGDRYGARTQRWQEVLGGATRRVTGGGAVTVRVPVDRLAAVAELVLAEQECCPFLTFGLEVTGPDLDLTVRAPAAATGPDAVIAGWVPERPDTAGSAPSP
jgi:MerR family transcriptional regulator, copper efflux regulator